MSLFIPCLIGLVAIASTTLPSVALASKSGFSASASMAYDTHSFGGELFDGEQASSADKHQLRRLKLSSKYKFSSTYSGKVSTKYSVNKSRFVLDDAYIRANLGSRVTLTAGQFKEPFGLEKQQGLSFGYLMERSVVTNTLTFSRKPGVKILIKGERWRWDAAIMQVEADSPKFSDATAYISRFTFAPVTRKKAFLHLGAGWSTRDGVGREKYDIDEPLIARSFGNLIHSANIKVDSVTTGNLEFAGKYGPVVLQSEILFQDVLDQDNVNYHFGGYYTSLLWTVLGRSRTYKNGAVEFAKPKRHTLELALRFSMSDVEAYRDGDVAEVLSLGLNYYHRSTFRLSLNYERADLTSFSSDDWDTYVKGDAISARLQLMM